MRVTGFISLTVSSRIIFFGVFFFLGSRPVGRDLLVSLQLLPFTSVLVSDTEAEKRRAGAEIPVSRIQYSREMYRDPRMRNPENEKPRKPRALREPN